MEKEKEVKEQVEEQQVEKLEEEVPVPEGHGEDKKQKKEANSNFFISNPSISDSIVLMSFSNLLHATLIVDS